MFWISDKETFVAAEEFGHDLEHVEVGNIMYRRTDNINQRAYTCCLV